MQQKKERKVPLEDTVVAQFKADHHFIQQEEAQNKRYIVQLQIARFGDLRTISQKDIVINAGHDKDGYTLIYVIGQRQPEGKADFQKFMQHFIVMLDEKLDGQILLHHQSGYKLIYFNSGIRTHSTISSFIEFYKMLPLKYYSKLVRFYIVHGNIMLKSWLWFQKSIQNQVLKSKMQLVNRLLELGQEGVLDRFSAMLIPAIVRDCDSSNEVITPNEFIAQQLMTLVAAGKQQQQSPEQILQQQKAMQSVKVLGIHLHEYEMNKHGIPEFLDVLISTFVMNPHYFQLEGIFRKNASTIREKEVEQLLSKKQFHAVEQYEDPYTLAGIIKQIFDKMPIPIVPYSHFRPLIQNFLKTEPINHVQFIRGEIKTLPPLNQTMFMFILSFLSRLTESKEENLMTPYNVAVVFGPCFLRPETYSLEDIKNTQIGNQIVQITLENIDQVFPHQTYQDYLTRIPDGRSQSVLNPSQHEEPMFRMSNRATVDFSAKK